MPALGPVFMDLATVFCYQRNSSKTKQHWNWEKNKEEGLPDIFIPESYMSGQVRSVSPNLHIMVKYYQNITKNFILIENSGSKRSLRYYCSNSFLQTDV